MRRGLWDHERHRLPALHAPGEHVVLSVDQLDKHLVLTGWQTRDADCIDLVRFYPSPRKIVDVYVQMPGVRQGISRLTRCVDYQTMKELSKRFRRLSPPQ